MIVTFSASNRKLWSPGLVIIGARTSLLADEKFYEWISKRSGVFDESLEKFKEIKEKIEK